MTIRDNLKTLIGAYLGVRFMDSYSLKEYVLKDIENTIKDFLEENYISEEEYNEIYKEVEENMDVRRKLQDVILLLGPKGKPMELIMLINDKLKEETL